MILFEFKKIFESRLNVIAMAAGYILTVVCVFSYFSQARMYDETRGEWVSGMEAVRLLQERAKGQTAVISEEYMTDFIRKIQNYDMDLESDEAYMTVVAPLGSIYYFASKNYTDMRKSTIDRNALNLVDLEGGARFYEQRMKKLEEYLNLDFSYGNYSESEKSYWIKKAEAVETPFAWGDTEVMEIVWETAALGFFMLFVVVIGTCSVFSSEHESGAVSLLLTTKYGKDRLVGRKIMAALLFAVGYLLTVYLLAMGMIGVMSGFPGADLPVQLWNSVIPYSLTAMQLAVINMGIILLLGIGVTAVMLFCSARLKSSLATLVVGVVLLIVPAFLPMSRSSGLWNHINYLFPVRVMNVKNMLGAFVSYRIGGLVVSYLGMTLIVYTAVTVLALLPVRKGFIRMK